MAQDTKEKFAQVRAELQELLSGIFVVKVFSAEKRSTLRTLTKAKEAIRAEIKLDFAAAIASLSSVILSSLGPLVLIWYGCYEIIHGRLTVGGLMAFTSFMGFVFTPVRSLYDLNFKIQGSLASLARVFEMLSLPLEESGKTKLVIQEGTIRYEHVSFSHAGRSPTLKDISFQINAGESVAIIGRSGSGKTTLITLLLKLYTPGAGKIFVDDHETSAIDTQSIRRQIGFASQDTFLFADTVFGNIRYGNPSASDEDVMHAARLADAHDFIMHLPEGYNSKIAENGKTLSGGQRQRLSIARALVKKPKILILDEATSQIDKESEQYIIKVLKNISKTITTIIITHRVPTIQHVNRILILDQGKLVDQGTHEELQRRNTLYSSLCNSGQENAIR